METQPKVEAPPVITHEHASGEVAAANSVEAARGMCPVLGKMSLEEAGLLLELEAMGKELLAEQEGQSKPKLESASKKIESATEPKPQKVERTKSDDKEVLNAEPKQVHVAPAAVVTPAKESTDRSVDREAADRKLPVHIDLQSLLADLIAVADVGNEPQEVSVFEEPPMARVDILDAGVVVTAQGGSEVRHRAEESLDLVVSGVPGQPSSKGLEQWLPDPDVVVPLRRWAPLEEAPSDALELDELSDTLKQVVAVGPWVQEEKFQAAEITEAEPAVVEDVVEVTAAALPEALESIAADTESTEGLRVPDDGPYPAEASEVTVHTASTEVTALEPGDGIVHSQGFLSEVVDAGSILEARSAMPEVVEFEVKPESEPVISLTELPAPVEVVEAAFVRLAEVFEQADVAEDNGAHQLVQEIMVLPAGPELGTDEEPTVVERELERLFIDLFAQAEIEYTPELVESFVKLTRSHYLEEVFEEVTEEKAAQELPDDFGTREFLQKLQRGFAAVKRSLASVCDIGRSVLRLYNTEHVMSVSAAA